MGNYRAPEIYHCQVLISGEWVWGECRQNTLDDDGSWHVRVMAWNLPQAVYERIRNSGNNEPFSEVHFAAPSTDVKLISRYAD